MKLCETMQTLVKHVKVHKILISLNFTKLFICVMLMLPTKKEWRDFPMKARANEHIRKAMRENDVTLWRVAALLGVSDITLGRWLRFPLPAEKEAQILEAIKTAAKGG